MAELSRQQRAAITKRKTTLNALLGSADIAFTDADYSAVKIDHIIGNAGISSGTFYTSYFSSKSAWGAAVIDQRLNEALDEQAAAEAELPRTPHHSLLGYFGLLAKVSAPLPGITKALIDERTDAQAGYGDLLPRYYSEVTQGFADGQEQQLFRDDIPAADLAAFALDSIVLAYAVHLDNPAARAVSSSLVLDGLRAA